MVAFARGGALLERERELEALRDGVDRACAGEGTLLLNEGPAGARGARGGRAGADDAARGERFGARAVVCLRRGAPAAGAGDQQGPRAGRSVRGRRWSRGAVVRAR